MKFLDISWKFLDISRKFSEIPEHSLQKHFKIPFPFDVMSYSKKNVLRGLHLQRKNPQAKLITVLSGKVFDVCVDCRKKSKTFGKYFSIKF